MPFKTLNYDSGEVFGYGNVNDDGVKCCGHWNYFKKNGDPWQRAEYDSEGNIIESTYAYCDFDEETRVDLIGIDLDKEIEDAKIIKKSAEEYVEVLKDFKEFEKELTAQKNK